MNSRQAEEVTKMHTARKSPEYQMKKVSNDRKSTIP